MLPDFPNLKSQLRELLTSRLEKVQAMYLGFISDIPEVRIFEGDQIILARADGSVEELESKKSESIIQVDLKEIEEMSIDSLVRKIDKAAKEMAEQRAKGFLDVVNEGVEKSGNVVNAKGRDPLDVFFEMFEKRWMEFDENGNPNLPMIIQGTNSWGIFEIFPQLKTDPNLKKRFDEVIQRKRQEWNAEESNRKLVG